MKSKSGDDSDHVQRIRKDGLSYLQSALSPNVSGEERGVVILAGLEFLNSKARRLSSSATPSQSQSAYLTQSAAPQQSGRTSAFINTLAEGIDFEIPGATLTKATVEAAKLKALPILGKCLSVLSKKSSVGFETNESALFEDPPMKKRKSKKKGSKRKSKKIKTEDCPVDFDGDEEGEEEDEEAELDVDDDAEDIKPKGRSGKVFVDDFVTKLVRLEAYQGQAEEEPDFVFLASCAREAPLTAAAVKTIFVNLVHGIQYVSLFELPGFVYQMLLFASSKGNLNSKKLFLVSLAQQFSKLEENVKKADKVAPELEDSIVEITEDVHTLEEVRQVQGTTLFHMDFALKQDPGLVSELIKLAKSNIDTQSQLLTPFGVAILLALARSPSVQNEVLNHIRDSLAKFEKERLLREKNLFVARVTYNDDPLVRPAESLVLAAKCTGGNGWEFIAEPFFGFMNLLLDRPLPTEKHLALDLMRSLYRAQPTMRKAIMEQIVSRLALRDKSAPDVIQVLNILAKRMPVDVLEQSDYIRNCIEECIQLPPLLARSLIIALLPLLRSRRDLLDYFFIVMRKSLFHHETNHRAVSALGFLTILDFRPSDHELAGATQKNQKRRSSQRPLEARYQVTDADVARIKAASQPLRRVMSHPPALKALFYKNIDNFVSKLKPGPECTAICESLKEFLRPYFLKFIDAQSVPYVVLHMCVDESSGGRLTEPLGDLIQCLFALDSVFTKNDSESFIVELARKVATVSITDFSISKDVVDPGTLVEGEEPTAEQLAERAAAKANRVRARVLGNVADALINASLKHALDSGDEKLFATTIFPLLVLRDKVLDVLKSLGSSSVTDAVRDMRGDATIESGQPAPLLMRRPGKPSGKKSGKGGKGKGSGKQNDDAPTTTSNTTSDYRLGAFKVMFSSVTTPAISFNTAITCLEKIHSGRTQIDDIIRFFRTKKEVKDVVELHAYLLAVVTQHLHNTNGKYGTYYGSSSEDVCKLAGFAMRRIRELTDNDGSLDRLKYLTILESCAKTLTTVFEKNFEVYSRMAVAIAPRDNDDDDDEYEGRTTDFAAMSGLEEKVEHFLERQSNKEYGAMLRTYSYISKSIEVKCDNIEEKTAVRSRQAEWARNCLNKFEDADPSSVRILSSLTMQYSINNDDLRTCEQIIDRIHVVIGDCDAMAEAPVPTLADIENSLSNAEAIRRPTSLAATESILNTLDVALDDVEWCLARMVGLEALAAAANENIDQDGRGAPVKFVLEMRAHEKKVARASNRAEDAALTRLEGILRNLKTVTSCAIVKWSVQERVLKSTTRAYKCLSIATSAQMKRKGDPRTTFVTVIEQIKLLAPILWKYVSFLGTEAGTDDAKKTGNRTIKEGRLHGGLVYESEKFEKVLIALQKRTKVPLLRNFRRNTARDFRIITSLIDEQQ